MSADLRTIRPEFKEILLNRNLIKLNQVRGEGIGADQAYVGQLEINSKRRIKNGAVLFRIHLGCRPSGLFLARTSMSTQGETKSQTKK